MPFSKRAEASDLRSRRRAVLLYEEGVEEGALQGDVARARIDLGVLPAHDAGESHGTGPVADKYVPLVEFPVHAVKGAEDRLARGPPSPRSSSTRSVHSQRHGAAGRVPA